MTNKFQNKYRIPSARLRNWDYGSNAIYFVTICTAQHECYFGNIKNGEMQLSEIGKIANHFWKEIPNHFSFVELGEFVIMPNHVHGIIRIDKPIYANGDVNANGDDNTNGDENANGNENANVETPKLGVSTATTVTVDANPNGYRTINASAKWNPESLGVIINQYKRIVTINARKIHADYAWQSRFHDHIIRNDGSYQRILDYIINNPLKWANDKFFKP